MFICNKPVDIKIFYLNICDLKIQLDLNKTFFLSLLKKFIKNFNILLFDDKSCLLFCGYILSTIFNFRVFKKIISIPKAI